MPLLPTAPLGATLLRVSLAGKRRSTRLKKGAPWLKTALVQAAWAAVRKKQSYLQAQFQRLRARRGPRKAICAVAASMLTAAYHMLKDGTFYADPGPQHFRKTEPMNRAKALARQIERLGFTCSISPAESVLEIRARPLLRDQGLLRRVGG